MSDLRAQLTTVLTTWKEHSHPPPHLRRGPCPACGILIDLANVLRELSVERVTCRHCAEELRLIDGDWLDCETHTVCDTPAGQPVRQHEPEQQL